MLNNVGPTRALDESQAHVGPPRPHAAFAPAVGEPGRKLPAWGSSPISSTVQQLSQLQRRSRDVLGHKLVLNPVAPVLRRLGHELLSNIHQIQEIERRATGADWPHKRVVLLIQDLIQASHRLLDVIVGQIALCDSTTREAQVVAEWGRRLSLQDQVKLYKLMPLFDRVCDEIRRTQELRMLLPLPGLHLAAVVESQSGQPDAANFTGGILTARVLVWMLGDRQRPTHDLVRLVLAALLQDVGRLPVVPGGASARVLRGQRPDWLEQQHPTIGAALLGSIRGAPIELPMLVAQHHEQLDGGGFPRALAAGDILPDAAILAATGRFAELCQMPSPTFVPGEEPTANDSSKVGKSAPVRAAEALLSEAEWGKWPLDFSRLLAHRVAQTEAAEQWQPLEVPVEVAMTAGSEPAPSDAEGMPGDRRLQLHDHERTLQGTHADPAPRHVGTTVRDGKSQFDND